MMSEFNLTDAHSVENLLEGYSFTAKRFVEDDTSITLSLNELDIVENGVSEEDAKKKLAQAILDYAEDFYKDYSYWSSAPNRKSHIPYVFKVLALDDTQKIIEQITCQDRNTDENEKTQATIKLLTELSKGEKAGNEQGWLSSEEVSNAIMQDVYEKLAKAQLEIESGNTIDAKKALKDMRNKYCL